MKLKTISCMLYDTFPFRRGRDDLMSETNRDKSRYRSSTSHKDHENHDQQEQEDSIACSYHIEDTHKLLESELKAIIPTAYNHSSTATDDKISSVPELLISYSSTPESSPTDTYDYDTWGNADEIPTRVPSAAGFDEDFTPLFRCRDHPAMGWYPNDLILDADTNYPEMVDDKPIYNFNEAAVASEWACLRESVRNQDHKNQVPSCKNQRVSICCKEECDVPTVDIGCKDGDSMSVVS